MDASVRQFVTAIESILQPDNKENGLQPPLPPSVAVANHSRQSAVLCPQLARSMVAATSSARAKNNGHNDIENRACPKDFLADTVGSRLLGG